MTGQSFVPLPGSERGSLPQSQELGAVDESQEIAVTLVTRRRAALSRDLVEGPDTLTRQQFAEQHGTDPADLSLITSVLAGHGLRVSSADAGARRVTVRGTIAALSATFGARLRLVRSPGPAAGQGMVEHRYREGGLQVPAELDGIVLAVLGLDDRPQARAHFRRAPAATARADAPAPAPPGGGSSDGQGGIHVDFPASSPHVLACGGTSLRGNAGSGVISSETVWNDGASGGATGGGVSDAFGVPSWQTAAGVPARAGAAAGTAAGRGVPDVAGCADPATGYQVRVDGQSMVVGGTSAVAPLWAALISRLAQSTGKPFGLIQPQLYTGVTAGAAAPGFRDITSGSNGAYAAGPGWDACTGLGSPEGSTLQAALASGQAGVPGA